jgi:probable rRNA maturation factor
MNDERIDVSIDVAENVHATVDHVGLRQAVVAALRVMHDVDAQLPPAPAGTQLEVSILVTDDLDMQRLNREYRGVDRPTDILSFSLVADADGKIEALPAGEVQSLGDIVISHAFATRQAEELGHSVDMELAWLVIHGTLQLLGYSHDTDDSAEHMEALEHAALERVGFTPR